MGHAGAVGVVGERAVLGVVGYLLDFVEYKDFTWKCLFEIMFQQLKLSSKYQHNMNLQRYSSPHGENL